MKNYKPTNGKTQKELINSWAHIAYRNWTTRTWFPSTPVTSSDIESVIKSHPTGKSRTGYFHFWILSKCYRGTNIISFQTFSKNWKGWNKIILWGQHPWWTYIFFYCQQILANWIQQYILFIMTKLDLPRDARMFQYTQVNKHHTWTEWKIKITWWSQM